MATKSFDEPVVIKNKKMANAMLKDLDNSSTGYVRGKTKPCSFAGAEKNAKRWISK